MTIVISVEHLSKAYRLGQIGAGTLSEDLNIWWAKIRGQTNPLVRIGTSDSLSRGDETVWALRDVSFTVNQGEVLGIIGRNGAGKSTLLKILSRVTAPTSGKVKIKGRVASLLEVGTGFHPDLTGRENIQLNGAILGMSRKEIERKFDEIVDFAEVEKFIDTPVKRYSSGMYVRLAFAVAAHLEPEILVVDEVLAVGDAEFQKKCLGKMGDVARGGRTVLFVSHNMAAVSALCSCVLSLSNGIKDQIGATDDVIQKYLSRGAFGISDEIHNVEGRPVQVVNFLTMNADGQPLSNIMSGQDVYFCIDYQMFSARIEQVVCVLNFKTAFGQPLFSCNTRIGGDYLSLEGPTGRIVCFVPKIPLNQGSYYIDILLKQGIDKNNILYELSESIEIHVLTGDFFSTGHTANIKSSPMLVQHEWAVLQPFMPFPHYPK